MRERIRPGITLGDRVCGGLYPTSSITTSGSGSALSRLPNQTCTSFLHERTGILLGQDGTIGRPRRVTLRVRWRNRLAADLPAYALWNLARACGVSASLLVAASLLGLLLCSSWSWFSLHLRYRFYAVLHRSRSALDCRRAVP